MAVCTLASVVCRDTHITLFEVPIMLCSNSPTSLLYTYYALILQYCKWVVHITDLFSLLVITLATHFCAQNRQATTTLDLIAH